MPGHINFNFDRSGSKLRNRTNARIEWRGATPLLSGGSCPLMLNGRQNRSLASATIIPSFPDADGSGMNLLAD